MRFRFINLPVLMICFTLLVSPLSGRAENDLQAEYLIKAAFIYRFAMFVEWPSKAFDAPKSPLVLYVFGEDPFKTTIETIEGKMIGNRRLSVRQYKALEDAEECHILFISGSEKGNLRQILDQIRGKNILTIGDTPGFAEKGGVVINLIRVEDKIRFEINVDAAERSGLRISSQLLRLAKIVREKPSKASTP